MLPLQLYYSLYLQCSGHEDRDLTVSKALLTWLQWSSLPWIIRTRLAALCWSLVWINLCHNRMNLRRWVKPPRKCVRTQWMMQVWWYSHLIQCLSTPMTHALHFFELNMLGNIIQGEGILLYQHRLTILMWDYRIGIYTRAERRAVLSRYRLKKSRRVRWWRVMRRFDC